MFNCENCGGELGEQEKSLCSDCKEKKIVQKRNSFIHEKIRVFFRLIGPHIFFWLIIIVLLACFHASENLFPGGSVVFILLLVIAYLVKKYR